MSRHVLTYHARPPVLNSERAGHWRQHRESTREWREAWWAIGLQSGLRLHRVTVTATPILRGRRSQDCGAVAPAVKAALDGLVDARVLPGDSPAHVTRLTFEPPVLGAAGDALCIVLEDLETPT